MHKIHKANTPEEKLEILLGQKGFQLAMASAILTTLYPNDFTVYDFRVRSQLINPKTKKPGYPDISYAKDRVRRYFDEYLRQVREFSALSLRDNDRALWAKSWYVSLGKFLKK